MGIDANQTSSRPRGGGKKGSVVTVVIGIVILDLLKKQDICSYFSYDAFLKKNNYRIYHDIGEKIS